MFAASKSGRVAAAAATDPYFPYVPLLLETTSTNGQQNNTFLDSSTNNFTITRNGTPTQGSVTPYWPNGYWSNYFNGSSDYISVADNAALELGAGDFTLEGWFNFSSLPSTNGYQATLFSKWATSNASYELYLYNSSGTYALYLTYSLNGSASTNLGPISFTPTLGVWYHIAVCRSSTNIIFYVNGTQQGSTQTLSGTIFDGSGSLSIGNFNAQANTYFNGYVSNARVVKGVAVYTGTFTPPTSPLAATQSSGTNIAAITGTATGLLTCQSNRFKDNSTNNFTLTTVGTPRVQAFQPFSPTASYTAAAYGGSGYFGGSGNYLLTTGATALGIGASAFTLEGWCYFNDVNTSGAGFGTCAITTDSASDRGVSLFLTGSGAWRFRIGRSVVGQFEDFLGTTTLITGQWYNFKIVRTSTSTNDTRIYLNGVQEVIGTSTISLNMQKFSVGTYAPSDATSALLNGYVTGVRFTNTAVSSSVPTSPVTPITGTQYLASFTNAGIYDAAVQNNAITVGDAQASTTVSKWSPTSMKFDGTGDYLLLPSTQFQSYAFGTNDFTIECWLYQVTFNADTVIAASYGTWSSSVNFYFATRAGTPNVLLFRAGDSLPISLVGNTGITANTWTHVAVSRASGVTRMFVGGVLQTATHTGSVNISATVQPLGIGAANNATEFINAYIQDLRFTKGYARYTANFSVPTAAFPTR